MVKEQSIQALVYTCFETKDGPATKEQIQELKQNFSYGLPDGLIRFYLEYGSGAGFAGEITPLMSDEEGPQYVHILPPQGALELSQMFGLDHEFLLFGSNGGGCWYGYHPDRGFFEIDAHDNNAEYELRIANSFEEFLTSANKGGWYA